MSSIEQIVTEHGQMKRLLNQRREGSTKATRRYRESHRDKVNQISKNYYERKKQDPVWLQQKRERQRIYQKNRRENRKNEGNPTANKIETPGCPNI